MGDLYRQLLARSGGHCECGGECERTLHGFRMAREHGLCERAVPSFRLIVAPVDLQRPLHEAARLPVDELRLWCEFCLARAEKTARQIRDERCLQLEAANQLQLFPAPAGGVPWA